MSTKNEMADSPLRSETLTNILIGIATLGTVQTSFIIYYTKMKLKINALIKSLLIFQFFLHILNNGLIIYIAIQLAYNYDSSDQTTCLFFGISTLVLYPAHFFTNTAITLTRLFIAWKTENHRLFEPILIMRTIKISFLLYCGVKFSLLYLGAGAAEFFPSCLYKDDGNNAFNYVSVVLNICIVTCGGLADALLVVLLKKIKTRDADVQENEPIPWKSGNHSKTSLRVPVIATVLSSISFFTIMVSVVVYINTTCKELLFFFVNFRSVILFMILDPVTIFLTLKFKQEEIINKIPKCLTPCLPPFLPPQLDDIHDSTSNANTNAMNTVNTDHPNDFGNEIESVDPITKPINIEMDGKNVRNVRYIIVKSCHEKNENLVIDPSYHM